MLRATPKDKSIGIPVRFKSAYDYHALNRDFTFACLSTPPIIGSVSSFILNGGALWGFFKVCSRSIRFSRDRGMIHLAVPIYAYSAAYLASFVLNPVTNAGWRYLLPIATFLLFPFLYSSWCISRKVTIATSAVTASIVACYGAFSLAVIQFHLFGMRAEGGAGNAIVFATATCLAASIALAGVFSSNRTSTGWLLGAFLAGAAAILYSGSRITWVAFLLSVGAILYVYRKEMRARLSKWSVFCAVMAIGAVAIISFKPISLRIGALAQDWQQLTVHGNHNTSLGLRGELWEIGFNLALESPFIGHGPQSTKRLIAEGFREKIGLEAGFTHFHNGFLTAIVETGIFGAVSLAALFAVAARNAARTLAASCDSIEKFGAVVLIIVVSTYTINGLTGILVGHDILDSVLMTFLVLGTFLSSGISLLDPEAEAPARPAV